MKTWLLVSFLIVTCGPLAAVPEETTLRASLLSSGANYCYRFTSWHENPGAARFVVTFNFFYETTGQDGVLSAYESGIPMPKRASAIIETHARGKVTTHSIQLDAKAAHEMVCRFGYSGFFATDSNDPVTKYFDGHGLTAERLYSDKYVMKTRSYAESLSSKWLYDFLERYSRKR